MLIITVFSLLVVWGCANTYSTKTFVPDVHVFADELLTRDYLSIITPSPTQLLSLSVPLIVLLKRGGVSPARLSGDLLCAVIEPRSCRSDQGWNMPPCSQSSTLMPCHWSWIKAQLYSEVQATAPGTTDWSAFVQVHWSSCQIWAGQVF